MKEYSIMPECSKYYNVRREGLHRHEIFYGSLYRRRSIEDGLVVFLPPELHNMSDKGVHFNKKFDLELKQLGQQVAMDYYGWTEQDFIDRYGKSYL